MSTNNTSSRPVVEMLDDDNVSFKRPSQAKEILRRLRKNKGAQNIDDVQIPDPRKSIEERAADKDQAMAVHRVLQSLWERKTMIRQKKSSVTVLLC